MKRFEELTEAGRQRRMRRAAETAASAFGIRAAHLRRLPGDTNSVYAVRTAAGRRLVVRVGGRGALAHGTQQILSETAWLDALAVEAPEIRAPVPLRTAAGEHMVRVSVPGIPEPRPCVAFEWIPGRLLDDEITAHTLEAYGMLFARLHRHAAGYRPPEGGPRPRHDRVFPYEEPVVLFGGDHPYFPPERRAVFVMAAARVEGAVADLVSGNDPMRVLHGDLHVGNVLVSRRGPAALDFEDHLWGWPIQDLGIGLYYLEGRPDFSQLAAAIRRGYERVAPWPEPRSGMLEEFMAARVLVLANGVVHLQREDAMAPHDARSFFERAEARLRRLLPAAPAQTAR